MHNLRERRIPGRMESLMAIQRKEKRKVEFCLTEGRQGVDRAQEQVWDQGLWDWADGCECGRDTLGATLRGCEVWQVPFFMSIVCLIAFTSLTSGPPHLLAAIKCLCSDSKRTVGKKTRKSSPWPPFLFHHQGKSQQDSSCSHPTG